jgi:hypothetical protein
MIRRADPTVLHVAAWWTVSEIDQELDHRHMYLVMRLEHHRLESRHRVATEFMRRAIRG